MEQTLVQKISAWTEEQFEKDALIEAIEAAADDASAHRSGFSGAVEALTPEQSERCDELISFAFSLLDRLDLELESVLEGLEQDDRGRVIASGEQIHRVSFQLNQTFGEFRNQALAALGPTDVPNFNHLIKVKIDYLAAPSEETKLAFKESIRVERLTIKQALTDLEDSPEIPETVSLKQLFEIHAETMQRLDDDLDSFGAEADFDAIFATLDMEFRELAEKIPATTIALRTMGDTEYPDLNYLLSMIVQVETGMMGDAPLVEALQICEVSFFQSMEKLKAYEPTLDSTLAREEVQAAIKCFDVFGEGVQNTYRFLAVRELVWLKVAASRFRDFAKELSEHKERLKELEALEGKTTCPRCSEVNEAGRQRCSKCGFPLPQNVASTTTTTFQTREAGDLGEPEPEGLLITSNLEKLYRAVNGVSDGSLDDSSFVAEVDKFEALVNAGANSLPDEPKETSEHQGIVDRAYDEFDESVEHFKNGIELLRGYIESRSEEDLKDAVLQIDRGAKKMMAAGRAAAVATAPAGS